MALSVGFIRFVSSADATQVTGLLTVALVGLTPTEHASLCWTHWFAKLLPNTETLAQTLKSTVHPKNLIYSDFLRVKRQVPDLSSWLDSSQTGFLCGSVFARPVVGSMLDAALRIEPGACSVRQHGARTGDAAHRLRDGLKAAP